MPRWESQSAFLTAGEEAGQWKRKGIAVAPGIFPGYALEQQGTLAPLFQQKQQAPLVSTMSVQGKGGEMGGVGERCSMGGEDQVQP